MNKKEKRAALKSALSNAVAENKLIIVDDIKLAEIKTKNFQAMLDAFKVNKAFVLLDSNDKNVILSARNIQDVKTAGVNELNVYDVLKYQTVVATKAAVEKIQEVYA
jgi:large subunit ribosomal protein L4